MTVAFAPHIELLGFFLGRRGEIVDSIETLLNCQKKPVDYQQDYALLSRQFKDCFVRSAQTAHRDQLEHAHWADGFKPRAQAGNELVDPVEQMLRALHMWRLTHWPGQKGRMRYAHTLFNLHVLRNLALLGMRLWDEDTSGVTSRLAQLQAVLDALWQGTPADQPRSVRDVRWLFPVAMSPTTDSLAGYFTVAARIADTFTEADRVETQKAWVQTGAGHLRAQLHDLAKRRNVAIDDPALVLLTRVSNALDVALLMEGLVTLLDAYERSVEEGAAGKRLELAAAICQGVSPDPELFVERLDLLGPYTMIEHLFVTTDAAGAASYTVAGQRHLALLARYTELLKRLASSLHADCRHAKPPRAGWSPYGALYGFASNLLELISFKTLTREATTAFSMEDVFTPGGADKLAWVNGWRKLPHIKPEVVQQFEYPRQFADDVHARVEQALYRRASGTGIEATGRLFLSGAAQAPELATQYVVASDPRLVAAGQATAKDEDDLLHCRNEGEFLVSYQTAGGWVAITKDLLTEVLGAGKNARLTGLPPAAAAVLRLMCPAGHGVHNPCE